MEKLSTIQKRENLNVVIICDKQGNGGAHHHYRIADKDNSEKVTVYAEIQFQNGARKLLDSIHGVLDTDLLEIVRHRLQCFQQGELQLEKMLLL